METQTVRPTASIVPSRLSTSVLLPSDSTLPSGTVLASPRLSALDHYRRLYGYNDPQYQYQAYQPSLAPVNQQVVDDIIDKYVRRPDGSPVKSQEEKRAYGSLSPSAAALVKAEDTVNALKQSGINPVAATDKALGDSGLLNNYGLAPLAPLYNPYHGVYHPYHHYGLHHGHHGHHYLHGHHHHAHKDHKDHKEHKEHKDHKDCKDCKEVPKDIASPLLHDSRYLDPLGYRYGGYQYGGYPYGGYPYGNHYGYGYPYSTVSTVAPVKEEAPVEKKEEAPKVVAPQLNDADFYKKYGFYPNYTGYSSVYPTTSNYGSYPYSYGSYPYGSNYGYPYGSYGRSSYVNADGKVVDYPNIPTNYTRQYIAPQEQQAAPKSNSGSRKPSQQVDDDRFDFEGEKKKDATN